MADENCDTCHTDYDFTPENAKLVLFLENHRGNHIAAKCPQGHVERIFTTTSGFLRCLKEYKLSIQVNIAPPEELLKRAEETWAERGAQEDREDTLPEIPRDWLINLHDTLREFGGES